MSATDWQTPHLDRLEEMSGLVFRHIQNRLEEEGGISPSQFYLLRLLQRRGVLTVSDLAARLGMTAAGATGLVDRLVKSGLVTRRRDEQDRRVVWVELSPAGAERLQETRLLRRKVISEILAPLSPAELEQMVQLYQKITADLTTI